MIRERLLGKQEMEEGTVRNAALDLLCRSVLAPRFRLSKQPEERYLHRKHNSCVCQFYDSYLMDQIRVCFDQFSCFRVFFFK